MAFTYIGDLSTDLDKVRFYIQDTEDGNGPKPEHGNFTDAEISALVLLEGSWQLAVAGCFDALSAAWQDSPVFGVSDLGTTHGRIAEGFTTKANAWRERVRGGDGISSIGFLQTVRDAPFLQDLDTVEL